MKTFAEDYHGHAAVAVEEKTKMNFLEKKLYLYIIRIIDIPPKYSSRYL